MNQLSRRLRAQIEAHGPMPFRRFMESALYDPELGFYAQTGRGPGRRADYYTSVSVGSMFGRLLAAQIAHWLQPFQDGALAVVEAGAHDGRLAVDLLRSLREDWAPLSHRVAYLFIEPSPHRRRWQQETLAAAGLDAGWVEDWSELPAGSVRGVILSNELLDAFPVHRVGWDAGEGRWFEWAVTLEHTGFGWVRQPLPPGRVDTLQLWFPPELLAVLPDGFTLERCPAAADWWRRAARALAEGWLITFDYGLEDLERMVPSRIHGTLRAYHGHRVSSDLLACPGEQDLTAHVDFTALRSAGETEGLTTVSFESQGRFLSRLLASLASGDSVPLQWDPAQTRQFLTLIHPHHLGESFKVLIQRRNRAGGQRAAVQPAVRDGTLSARPC